MFSVRILIVTSNFGLGLVTTVSGLYEAAAFGAKRFVLHYISIELLLLNFALNQPLCKTPVSEWTFPIDFKMVNRLLDFPLCTFV